jgi:hypothetical protein
MLGIAFAEVGRASCIVQGLVQCSAELDMNWFTRQRDEPV